MNYLNSPYICNFIEEEAKAKNLSITELKAAISDCKECIKLNINVNKYFDQISVYIKELNNRIK